MDRDAVWKAITVEIPALVATVGALLAELDAAVESGLRSDGELPALE